jgi:hypothetical protein
MRLFYASPAGDTPARDFPQQKQIKFVEECNLFPQQTMDAGMEAHDLLPTIPGAQPGTARIFVPATDADRVQDGMRRRILAALGLRGGRLPRVDLETLARYGRYLAANLSFPFLAYYPEPATPGEAAEFSCQVLEVLDPRKHLGDEFDGLFCKARKGGFEVNLPLVELKVREESCNFRLLEDYWYWFWNWR